MNGIKGYISIREASYRWGVSERRVNQYCAAAVSPAPFWRCAALSPRRAPHDSAFVIPSRSSSLRRLSFPRYTILVICFTVFPVTSAACA